MEIKNTKAKKTPRKTEKKVAKRHVRRKTKKKPSGNAFQAIAEAAIDFVLALTHLRSVIRKHRGPAKKKQKPVIRKAKKQ